MAFDFSARLFLLNSCVKENICLLGYSNVCSLADTGHRFKEPPPSPYRLRGATSQNTADFTLTIAETAGRKDVYVFIKLFGISNKYF
jgi:hypothetical protein